MGFASKKRRRSARDSEETSGRWTPEEHRLFLEGILRFGRDWKKIQQLIRTRTLVQIRTHAQKVFKKVAERKLGSGGDESEETPSSATELNSEPRAMTYPPDSTGSSLPADNPGVNYDS